MTPQPGAIVTGRCTWWDDVRGLGFLRVPGVPGDILVLDRDVTGGRRRIGRGRRASFILDRAHRGWRARDVRVLLP
jgi:cold shock CspA family protein